MIPPRNQTGILDHGQTPLYDRVESGWVHRNKGDGVVAGLNEVVDRGNLHSYVGPVRRYERQHPGEMIDIKKLGRFS